MKIFKNLFSAVFLIFCFSTISPSVFAYEVQQLPGTENKGDFVVGPGRIELILDKGESNKQVLNITNRLGKDMKFHVEVEDFTGSDDPSNSEGFTLLGAETSPFSLKKFIKPETNDFILKHGERMVLPITVQIPKDSQPGGLYGSVVVSTSPPDVSGEKVDVATTASVSIVSRLGVLLFVQVKGEVKTEGALTKFSGKQDYYEKAPISFDLLFQNKGTVHLKPNGRIVISNILGKEVGEAKIDPFFVLPNSYKQRTITYDAGFMFGKYTGKVVLNRGYGDNVDEQSVSFWVLPWKVVVMLILGVIILTTFIVWIFNHFGLSVSVKKKR